MSTLTPSAGCPSIRKPWRRSARVSVGLALLAAAHSVACDGSMANLNQRIEARRLAADVLVQFTKVVDAGNRAVMADTDEVSIAFAKESEEAKAAVSRDTDALGTHLRNLAFSDELSILDEFTSRFAEYRELDRSILDLAVQNTNLKAQRLSFGPSFEAADAFRDQLQALSAGDTTAQGLRIQALAAAAVAAVREMQALQAPHIAESGDDAMTRFEKRAASSETMARTAVDTLAGLVKPPAKSGIAAARESLNRFVELNGEITALSRRNSNVRSLALSLGQKRTVSARCEESLLRLQDALSKRSFAGTR